ncbi:Fatty acid synthase subunit beta, partial [Zancudomyces culisetae]
MDPAKIPSKRTDSLTQMTIRIGGDISNRRRTMTRNVVKDEGDADKTSGVGNSGKVLDGDISNDKKEQELANLIEAISVHSNNLDDNTNIKFADNFGDLEKSNIEITPTASGALPESYEEKDGGVESSPNTNMDDICMPKNSDNISSKKEFTVNEVSSIDSKDKTVDIQDLEERKSSLGVKNDKVVADNTLENKIDNAQTPKNTKEVHEALTLTRTTDELSSAGKIIPSESLSSQSDSSKEMSFKKLEIQDENPTSISKNDSTLDPPGATGGNSGRGESEEEYIPPRVRVYGSTVSGNRKYKKEVQEVFRILEAFEIEFDFVCIAADQQAKSYVKRKALGNMTLPQIYVDGEFVGFYDDLFNANEDGVKDYEYDLQQEYIKLFVESDFTLSQCINDSDGDSDKLGITKSKLLMLASQGTVGLFGVFGGQGVTDNYFEEIKEYYNTYRPLVYPFVKEASTYLKNIFKAIDQEISIEKELNILEWLEQKEPVPDSQFFSQVSVSFPLIGLLQLISYMVLYKSLSSTPGCISGYFKGFVGHSQGSIAAVAVASSTDEKSYIFNSLKALGILSILGNVVQKRLRDDAFDTGFPIIDKKIFLGKPSNMLLVDKISIQELKLLTASLNKGLKPEKKNYVSIRNGIKSFVVSGPKNSLLLLLRKMNELYTRQNKNLKTDSSSLRRSHIPSSMFLNIMAPFHSEHLRKYVEEMVRFTKVYNCEFSNEELLIPVYSSFDGRSLVTCKNLTRTLIEEICAKKLDWIKATELKDITHIVDFGPGGISGIGSLTANNKLGTGVQVIFASTNKIIPEGTKTLVDLLNNDPNSVTYSQNWEKEFGPKIVQNKYTGSLMLDTRMTRLLGKPHIMVAGMTPSTIGSDFVSSVLNSGYHIELAGGGHYSEASLREEVEKIRRNIGPGDGITVNVIFLNARMASLQLPLLNRMRLEGAPIDGVCISAGVPSLETSTELIEGMIQCGIKHISFKPGNAESIRQVVLVAKNNPKMNIILQWTGGRGGGHHSSEDFHQPILETYAEIRMCENVVLVAGSGFGGDKDTLPYITGDW